MQLQRRRKKGGIMVVSLPKLIVTFVLPLFIYLSMRAVTGSVVRRAVSRRQCRWFGSLSKTTSEKCTVKVNVII